MSTIDTILLMTWLALTLGAGIWAGLRADLETFWVNNRATSIPLLVFTVVATQVGAGAIIGIASATFSSGLGFGLVSLASTVFGFLALAHFAPAVKNFGDRFRAITLAELFRARYGRHVQIIGGLVILFVYLSLLAAQFRATSALISFGTGLDIKTAVLFATVGVILYSAFAGIRGDIVTDAMHFWAMALVFFLTLFPVITLKHPPTEWTASIPSEIWSPLTFAGYPFLVLGLLIGAIIPLLAPELWVKIYASKSAADARKVFLLSAAVVVPFYAFAIYLGVLGHALYKGVDGDALVFRFIYDFLPPGLLGFGIACVLSVIVSTANTLVVIVAATVFRDLLPSSSDGEKGVWRSRLITGVAGIVGAAMAMAAPNLVQLLLNAFYMLLVLGPALVGTAWKKATAKGAYASIFLGAASTITFLFISPREAFLPGLILSALSFGVVSLLTKHSPQETTELRAILE